ncbi:MAG: hypothetical protein JWL86_2790 [Rhizobium sp.]|nr:hypothetical protein [Rhizobium sp.]
MTCPPNDPGTAITVLMYIAGALSGVMAVIWFVCKDDRPIAEQFDDIRRIDSGIGPTEHGKIPL